ncbi:phBC6A51 family helix-turn-helix protein [Bacillus sp. DX4.1]|uniref:phBC6A51 family helix-turn-helix protein n=1 Tax=Bacillus sp. DX4.1 TaxID=3055867 RepID=UPI0025A20131|nr:phBC6A51 family helix-turn-helix protein [Bacillus sp. DX4.1]MDM5188603.1 phBC6A51 family helix-turn-helix protein [Bacillus sp. DX4.1]
MSDKKRSLEAQLTREQVMSATLLSINKFLPKASTFTTPGALEEAKENGQVRLSLEEIAEQSGISVRQLYTWRHHESNFIDYVNLLSSDAFMSHLPDVMQKHLDMMLKGQGSMKGIELFYKFGGLLVDKQEVKTENVDGNLSMEDRIKRLRARTRNEDIE